MDEVQVASLHRRLAFHVPADPARGHEQAAAVLDHLEGPLGSTELPDKSGGQAHRRRGAIERRGLVRAVVTQNIDTLHSRAGSEDVIEVHGSIRSAECAGCLWSEPADAVLEQLRVRPVPLCPHCGGPLKPGVVLFGEVLPPGAMERATELARTAALVLVVGSSLEVWPVAGLPLEARAFAIVNVGPTALDDGALLKIDSPAGDTLAGVLAELDTSG